MKFDPQARFSLLLRINISDSEVGARRSPRISSKGLKVFSNISKSINLGLKLYPLAVFGILKRIESLYRDLAAQNNKNFEIRTGTAKNKKTSENHAI